MNAAFRRSDAILRLESYAAVIIEHLALVTWYPEHRASKHWQTELNAFLTGLRRYNTGKGNGANFTEEMICQTFADAMLFQADKESILIGVESHGLTLPDAPNWTDLEKAISSFSKQIMRKEKKINTAKKK
jgi:hypothetical protein